MANQSADYPRGWEADVVLHDGTPVHIRPIRPSDADALQRFQQNQSEESAYFRFFAPVRTLTARELRTFTQVDHHDRVALVAVMPSRTAPSPIPPPDDDDVTIMGVGRYDLVEPGVANVAFNVADSLHGKGLGSILLEHLTAAARETAVHRFVAEVLPENHLMLAAFRSAGFDMDQHEDDGVVEVSLDLDPTEESRRVMAAREHRAESQSMRAFFEAKRVLLVGPDAGALLGEDHTPQDAGRWTAARLTWRVMEMVASDPGDTELAVAGLDYWPTVAEESPYLTRVDSFEALPPADLVVLACHPAHAAQVVEACGSCGARGVIMFTGALGEAGAYGIEFQRELVTTAFRHGMRVLGPGSYGMMTTRASGGLRASLSASSPDPGVVGLFSQSQAASVTCAYLLRERHLAMSGALSSGLGADLSGTDAMQYWMDDPATDVVCMYLDSVGNPRKFLRIAQQLATRKPLIVQVAGQNRYLTPPGQHQRSTEIPRAAAGEMLKRVGVIRVDSIHRMFDIAQLFSDQPLPQGRRVGIVASSSSLAVLVSEAANARNLEVVWASDYLGLERTEDDAVNAINEVFADGVCDAVIVADAPVTPPQNFVLASLVAAASARTGRPTVMFSSGMPQARADLVAPSPTGTMVRVPYFTTAEDAVNALAHVVDYSLWRERSRGGVVRPFGLDRVQARRTVKEWFAAGDGTAATTHGTVADNPGTAATTHGTLSDDQCHELLRYYGIHVTSESQVLQPASCEVACELRSTEDPLFGPVVSFGLAGDAVELLGDISYAMSPMTHRDVASLIRSAKASPRLFGYQGAPACDVAALEDVIGRVSALAEDLPEVAMLTLAPVMVGPHGVTIHRATIQLRNPLDRRDTLRRVISAL
ncbi:MAG: GNAT family N-acetyltransferase [Cellulomonadaceae bacterium]|nr:GNAT family N-acetyltransferase [Cellulomonadaceae bacterium]